jgi:hypothetical protein
MMNEKETSTEPVNNGRKDFLKLMLSLGAGIGLASVINKSTRSHKGKAKFLTPDGKLVEIDQSKISKVLSSHRASNDEILSWMDAKNHKS